MIKLYSKINCGLGPDTWGYLFNSNQHSVFSIVGRFVKGHLLVDCYWHFLSAFLIVRNINAINIEYFYTEIHQFFSRTTFLTASLHN